MDYAFKLGKAILPVLVAEGVNINLLSNPLHEIQVMDYRRQDKNAAVALMKGINKVPPSIPVPDDSLPTPPPVPVSYLSTLKDRINTSSALGPQEQKALVFELDAGLREGRTPQEIRDLLLSLKRRDDTLAKVASMIDFALESIGDMSTEPDTAVDTETETLPQSTDTSDSTTRCTNCGAQITNGSAYCSACGTVLTVAAKSDGKKSMMRRYSCAGGACTNVVSEVEHWLDEQKFDAQQLPADHNATLLQVKKRGTWRDFVGMSTSLNIVFDQTDDVLKVEIGAGKWVDKAIAGTVSLFVLWPLAVTAGFGAWE